jgi:hypothetical protein
MFQIHTHGQATAKFSARPGVAVMGEFTSPAARRLAGEIGAAFGVLLLWALLSALFLSLMEKAGDPRACVYLGRAGTPCVETSGGGAKNLSASGLDCRSPGRPGWDCDPKTPSR